VLPCIDTYTKVDLRTVSFDVPPQEVFLADFTSNFRVIFTCMCCVALCFSVTDTDILITFNTSLSFQGFSFLCFVKIHIK